MLHESNGRQAERADPSDSYAKKDGKRRKYLMGDETSGRAREAQVPATIDRADAKPRPWPPAPEECMHCQAPAIHAPYYHCLTCGNRVCVACEGAEKHNTFHVLAVIRGEV
jgi:hypothetical protein